MMRLWVSALLVCWLTSACTITVDDRRIFYPPDWSDYDIPHPKPAIHGEEALEAANITIADGTDLPVSPQLTIEHGVLPAEDISIAWSEAIIPVKRRPVFIDCTGNAADRYTYGGYTISRLAMFGDVFLFDYPGYGDSTGRLNAEDFDAAANAVGPFVRDRYIDRERVYWGYSLGGFLCARMAMQDPGAKLLILETPTRSIDTAIEGYTPWILRRLARIRPKPTLTGYDLVDELDGATFPVVVYGAEKDTDLPVRFAQDVVSALHDATVDVRYQEFEGANHYSVKVHPDFPLVTFDTLIDLDLMDADRRVKFVAEDLTAPPVK